MSGNYDLASLNPVEFEHMVNALALRVLGAGLSTFGPGPDGGRDGLFVGEAPYPSSTDRWSGTWYLQSKFHAPRTSGNEQKWLLQQIKQEIETFSDSENDREWPDIWIVASNVDPSGVAKKGTHDTALVMVREVRPELAKRFHIWGGDKIVELLDQHQEVAARYGHFLTPGHVLQSLVDHLQDDRASVGRIIDYLVVDAIEDSKYAKLEQAGSAADQRPGIHQLFVDIPFAANGRASSDKALAALSFSAAENHRLDSATPNHQDWAKYRRSPTRARVWVVQGGPGQGKSTLGQFFCQIQRAALILGPKDSWPVLPETRQLAEAIRERAEGHASGVWPRSPRIPIYLELKDYAYWLGQRSEDESTNVLAFLAAQIHKSLGSTVQVATLERALATRSWVVVFDGLDEVPSAIKDQVASEIHRFLRRTTPRGDLLALCTSRPQGYTGQFAPLGGASIELTPLSSEDALRCAEPLIRVGRSHSEAEQGIAILEESIASDAVQGLMRTPLQAHIMAVIVRAGERPPEMRWRLFDRFYQVIFNRERNKNHADPRLRQIFVEDRELLTLVHDHAGFVLHARAETAGGSEAALSREEFESLVRRLVEHHKDLDHDTIVECLMQAAKERLVLLNTPESQDKIRYDIRQLQEFFAARFVFHDVELDTLRERLRLIAGDSHWREVMHFLMSALVEGKRRNELAIALEVLTWLDQGEGDERTAQFCTRLARGGLIAARLLEDGVLEASKPDRHRFRDCLRACLTVDDLSFLKPLTNIRGQSSSTWFRSLLEDHAGTRKAGNSLGARRLLWTSLAEGNAQFPDIQQLLLETPVQLANWASDDLDTAWQLQTLTAAMQTEEYFTRLTVARKPTRLFAKIARPEADNLEVPPLLRWWATVSYRVPSSIFNQFGWVSNLSIHEAKFEPKDPQKPTNDSDFDSVNSKLFRLLASALRLDRRPSLESLESFLETLPIDSVPLFQADSLPGLVERIDRSTLTSALKTLPRESIEGALLAGKPLPGYKMPLTWSAALGTTGTIQQFVELAHEYPEVAVVVWCSLSDPVLGTPEALTALAQALHKEPDSAGHIAPTAWSPLLEIDSSLREVLVAHYNRSPYGVHTFPYSGSEEPVLPGTELNLPEEESVLLSLGTHLISSNADLSRSPEFVPEVATLSKIALSPSKPTQSRLGAVLVGLLHPDGGAEFMMKYLDVLALSASHFPQVPAFIALHFRQQGTWDDPKTRQLLNHLIAVSPIEASHRRRWRDLYEACREHSRAPVTSTGCREAWLNVGFEA